MPKESVATGAGSFDATGLETDLFGPDTEEGGGETPAVKPTSAENDSEESTEDNESDDTEGAESEEEEAEESSEDESSEESTEAKKPKGYRVGNQVFATADDAVAEATRIIGRNAQLAGDLSKRENAISDLQTQLQEAMQANQEWAEWAQAQQNGEDRPLPNAPSFDPDKIADSVAARIEARNAQRASRDELAKQVEGIIALPNFRQVANLVESIADKPNPLTGQIFTPNEAYDFAVANLGLPNLRKNPAATKPAPVKKLDRSAVKGAAARPGSQRMGTTPPAKVERSFADEMLAEQLL